MLWDALGVFAGIFAKHDVTKSLRKQNFYMIKSRDFFSRQQIFPGLCAEDAATTFASTVACTTTALLIAPKTRPFGEI